jgi:phage I-like protein
MNANSATALTLDTAPPALPVMERGGVPEWVMIARAGLWQGHPDGPEAIAPQHLQSALDYFRRHYRSFGAELPVDYHHGSILAAQGRLSKAPAAGWIQDMELRAGGTELWGRVLWTAEGARAIAAREFRHLSPVLRFSAPDRITGEPVPMVLHSVALTNTPFLTELQALSQNALTDAPEHSWLTQPGLSEQGGGPMPILEQMAAALGEPAQKVQSALGIESADDADVAAALLACSVRLRELEARLGEWRAILNALDLPEEAGTALVLNAVDVLKRGRSDAEAEKVVDEALSAGRITPAQRKFFLSCAREDPQATRQCLNSLTPIMAPLTGATPGAAGDGRDLSEGEEKVCRQLGLSAEAFLRAIG